MNHPLTHSPQAITKHSQKITDLSGRLLWVAGLLALVALVYWLMWRAWKKRAARHAGLPELPAIPEEFGEPLANLSGRYHASTTAGDWLDRIAAQGLGARSLAELTLTEQGVAVRRPAAGDFFIPAAALRGARLESGIAGKVVPSGGLLVITWLHGDQLIDSGFRSEHPAEHAALAVAIERMTSTYQQEGAR